MDDPIIVPKPGEEKETIRLLISLADKPRHVRTTGDGPHSSLTVPPYLHDRYVEHMKRESGNSDQEIPTPRRRGRPPGSKNAPRTRVEPITPIEEATTPAADEAGQVNQEGQE